jgi:hypothetical protein
MVGARSGGPKQEASAAVDKAGPLGALALAADDEAVYEGLEAVLEDGECADAKVEQAVADGAGDEVSEGTLSAAGMTSPRTKRLRVDKRCENKAGELRRQR